MSVGTEPTLGKLNLPGRSHVVVTKDVIQTQGNVSMVAPVYKDNLQSMTGQDRLVELVMWAILNTILSVCPNDNTIKVFYRL